MKFTQRILLALQLSASSLAKSSVKGEELPILDLGHELHQAISYNREYDYYNFTNIRYAQPPTGNGRFRAPLPPLPDRAAVKNGSETRICPQGLTLVRNIVASIAYQNGSKPFTLAEFEADVASATVPEGLDTAFNAFASEDCLFLDVIVPRRILEQAKHDPKGAHGAPVLAWIHGGGYLVGSKNGVPLQDYNPAGLLAESSAASDFIWVGINYRLGAFGFLAGPEVSADGAPNAGLRDQRLALEWIQDNIHLFGGSGERITILGESAGGGSVTLQTVAYGGAGRPAPFAQAISQSSYICPTLVQPENLTNEFLDLLNVSTVAEARKLAPEALIEANARQVREAPYSKVTYGPVVDGDFIPDLPDRLWKRGDFYKSARVLTGSNSREGALFFASDVTTDEELPRWLARTIPGLSAPDQRFVLDQLYPPVYDGSLGYVSIFSRQASIVGDAYFAANTLSLHEAYGRNSYAYEFAPSPGFHGQDLAYTFSLPAAPIPAPKARDALQQAIVSFVTSDVPSIDGLGPIPRWDPGQPLVNITEQEPVVASSNMNQTRLAWWQRVAPEPRAA